LYVSLLQRGEARARLAISDFNSSKIHVFDARSGSNEPLLTREILQNPVTLMRYNAAFDTVISTDAKGWW
jgi:peptidylprolyl isomerase domain and WD repeat-containing protein 1